VERVSSLTTELQTKLHRLTVGRYVQALTKGNSEQAAAFTQAQNWVDRGDIVLSLKSATSDTGTSDLPLAHNPAAEAFLHAERPLSLLMQLGEWMRGVPLRTRMYTNTQPIVAAQFVPGTRIPVLHSDWDLTSLELWSIGAVTVVTKELLENGSNAAQLAISDDLAAAVAAAETSRSSARTKTDRFSTARRRLGRQAAASPRWTMTSES